MLTGLRRSVKKAGQPPGTPLYTGKKKLPAQVTAVNYTESDYQEKSGVSFADCQLKNDNTGVTWVNIEGLNNSALMEEIAKFYNLHPLTVEDILNVEQRPKIDEYENYLFIALKALSWNAKKKSFTIEPISIVFGKNFVLTFQERQANFFKSIQNRLRTKNVQRLRQQGSDYLAYRIIDTIIDLYFVVLEGLGEIIEQTEELIITAPTQQNSKTLYRLKRKVLMLRKTIWPMREVISHLLQAEEKLISPFTRIYLRDVYDHIVQIIDTIEMFRDMLSSMLDMYLSSLTNRMNEIIKVLTIISTIFIPTTFIASIYGMNFSVMPELHWRYGYPVTLLIMVLTVIMMLVYFRRKQWF